jgi:hypothetical protein
MGLDVYLKRCENRQAELAKQAAAEEFSNAAWEKAGAYDNLSDAQKETVREAIRAYNAANDLDEYGGSNKIETIEIDSRIHPDNMFKIGYLRSSYNSGGINSVLRRIGCPDLYDIFEPKDGEYYVTVDWTQAQARAQIAVDRLKEYMGTEMAQYDVIEVNGYDPVGSKEEALALLKKELGHKSAFGGGYSNRAGDWFPEGMQIVGAVPGRPNFMGSPTYYLFTKSDEAGGGFKWYLDALEVTKEMIDYVLAQPDSDNYFLSWSA